MQRVALGLVFQHTSIRAAELSFVKGISKTFSGFGHFLVYLVIILGKLVFYQNISTIAFLGITVINQRVIERIHMSTGFPDSRMHKDG